MTQILHKSRQSKSRYFSNELGDTLSGSPSFGKFREDRPEHVFESGAVYKGEWLGNVRDGYGVQEWPDNARYEGMWKDNKAHG